jgi:ABC-2 type transport system ATP-binding protein
MIELRNVTKKFGTRVAVDNLSLTVSKGEICGLLGHNGAGKSTTIGMMLGQVWPTAGAIRICGDDVLTERGRALLRVGAIFETPAFYDYLSGWQNLRILSSYSAPTPIHRLREVMDWVGLSGREHSKVRAYSHGMRSRLALAQALVPQPELLILDEPSEGLDPEGIHEMRHTILRLRNELGLTILLSSHLLTEVQQLCTRIAVMNQGRKVFDGSLAEATSRQNWVRLRVGNFSRAVEILHEAKLVTDHRDSRLVLLADGATTDRVVQDLVGQGMPVFEIAPDEQTLEDFYLALMKPRADLAPNAEFDARD